MAFGNGGFRSRPAYRRVMAPAVRPGATRDTCHRVRSRPDRRVRRGGEDSDTWGEMGMSTTGTATEAYCVKCREKREIQNPKEVTMKNGRNAVEGTCGVCGTKLFRMVGNKDKNG